MKTIGNGTSLQLLLDKGEGVTEYLDFQVFRLQVGFTKDGKHEWHFEGWDVEKEKARDIRMDQILHIQRI